MTQANTPGIFVPPPFLFVAALAAGVLVDGNSPGWPNLGQASHLAGLAFALAGVGLVAISLGLFRRFRTRPEPWQPASALITSGLYRISRNPMYLGMSVTSAGVALYFESLAAGVLLVLVIAIVDRFVIQREERYLSRRFGTDYDAYRARVRRWL